MREIASMIVVLSIICGLSGFALSYLKIATEPLIEVQVLTYVQAPALKSVFPDAENDLLADRQKFMYEDQEITVFPAKKGGKLDSVALETFAPGYGGDVGVMVAFNMETDQLRGIGVTTLKETPGLGTRIAEEKYTRQFTGLDPKTVNLTSQGGSIDAVSGATISSTATVEAVKKAAVIYDALKSEFDKTFQNS
jgi:Na+-translocating ferredoxin:NAD+ oxidoreductase subunit G